MCLLNPKPIPIEEQTQVGIGYKIYECVGDSLHSYNFGLVGKLGDTCDSKEVWKRIGLKPDILDVFDKAQGEIDNSGFHVLTSLAAARLLLAGYAMLYRRQLHRQQISNNVRLFCVVKVKYTDCKYTGQTDWQPFDVKTDTIIAQTITLLEIVCTLQEKLEELESNVPA